MLFNSIDFMIFFPIVLSIYFVIPKKLRAIWLLIASYYFYMSWNPTYALLIAASTVVTYCSALLIDARSSKGTYKHAKYKKLLLLAALFINLGILGLFKYGNFVIDSIGGLLQALHVTAAPRRFDFLLPVGISFYTFQALGYLIDVYRGDIKAETDPVRYALFVSFFPQLVAGPIERSKNLLSQLKNISVIRLWDAKRVTSGAILMVWGYFMKMVIADRAAILVNTVFDSYQMYGSSELLLAALAFSLQIYCDFGSYSLIATGSARIMGVELMENFNAPYFARSVRDFWSRWHISLSTWFRDYLYIPLGGNRKGRIRKACNTMIVFLVSGLWHGADWHFVAWGGIHGFYQVTADLLKPCKNKLIEKLRINTECFSWKFLQTLLTYILVVFAWIFFRADNISSSLLYIKRIFTKPTPWLLFNGGIYALGLSRIEMNILFFSTLLLFMADCVRYKMKISIDRFLMRQNLWFEWLAVICAILMIFVFGEYGPAFDSQQFIYFQF